MNTAITEVERATPRFSFQQMLDNCITTDAHAFSVLETGEIIGVVDTGSAMLTFLSTTSPAGLISKYAVMQCSSGGAAIFPLDLIAFPTDTFA